VPLRLLTRYDLAADVIVPIFEDSSVEDPINGFTDDLDGDDEPFSGGYSAAEKDVNLEACVREKLMNEAFEFLRIEVYRLKDSDDVHGCE